MLTEEDISATYLAEIRVPVNRVSRVGQYIVNFIVITINRSNIRVGKNCLYLKVMAFNVISMTLHMP